jgi:hypothetical protein
MRIISILIISIFLTSCGEEISTPKAKKTTPEKIESLDVRIKRHAEVVLGINATEKYELTIYKEHLNDDDSIDYVVTINRFENAINQAIESGKVAKYVEMGYMGKHNHFFFVNGYDKKLGVILPIPSSPYAPLKISFENVLSNNHKDIVIDHHVKNSMFRNYFGIFNGAPIEFFKCELFLNLGEKDEKAFYVEYIPNAYSSAKDILIYDASIGEYEVTDRDDIYTVEPALTKIDTEIYHWFYVPSQRKYNKMKD